MPQHDQVIDNGPGLAVRTDINAAVAALFSSSSGDTAPSVAVPGQLWFDTSVAGVTTLKVRDYANAAWVALNTASSGSNVLSGANYIVDKPTTSPAYGYSGSRAGLTRWRVVPGNGTAESTGNAGSNFTIERYTDAGALIDAPFSIIRSSGQVVCSYALTVVGALTAASLDLTTALPVADGGTGGTTQATARSGIGCGTMATANQIDYYTKIQIDTLGLALSDGASVGSYLFATSYTGTALSPTSAAIAGGNLRPDNAAGSLATSIGVRAGSWRCLGGTAAGGGGGASTTLFQRIA